MTKIPSKKTPHSDSGMSHSGVRKAKHQSAKDNAPKARVASKKCEYDNCCRSDHSIEKEHTIFLRGTGPRTPVAYKKKSNKE